MKTKVTIGLCIKNAAKIVKTAFDSISIQDYPHELLKLVIVDDGSCDNTLSLAMKFAQESDIKTLVASSKGIGLGASRQIVVDNAEGDYIVWVDDDLVLEKDYIRKQVEFMEKNPNVGAARGFYNPCAHSPTIISIYEYPAMLASHSESLKKIGTGGAIFRIEALESVGGFDSRIKGAGEDQDVSSRMRESGWVLTTNCSARLFKKYPMATLKDLWKKALWYGYGTHFLFHKYKDKNYIKEFFPLIALLYGIKTSCSIYYVTGKKKVFVFALLYSFFMIAHAIGFINAHLDGYR